MDRLLSPNLDLSIPKRIPDDFQTFDPDHTPRDRLMYAVVHVHVGSMSDQTDFNCINACLTPKT